MAEMLADDCTQTIAVMSWMPASNGRDAEIASVQAQADLGVTHMTSTVIAIRGERLALSRVRSRVTIKSRGVRCRDADVVEIDADEPVR